MGPVAAMLEDTIAPIDPYRQNPYEWCNIGYASDSQAHNLVDWNKVSLDSGIRDSQ